MKKLITLLFISLILYGCSLKEEVVGDNLGAITKVTFNGKDIEYKYIDDTTNEALVIKSEKGVVSGWNKAFVNFSITNTTKFDENVKIHLVFEDGSDNLADIRRLQTNAPYEITVDDRGDKEYVCDTDFVLLEEEGETNYTCNYDIINCASVTGKTCIIKNVIIGDHKETRYRDMWVEGVLSKEISRDTIVNKKDLDSKFTNISKNTTFNIGAGTTEYFKATITFQPRQRKEFIIEVYGDNNSYGVLR